MINLIRSFFSLFYFYTDCTYAIFIGIITRVNIPIRIFIKQLRIHKLGNYEKLTRKK